MSSADVHGIRRRLESLDTITDLRSLFIEGLNYQYRDQVLRPEDVLSGAVREPVEKLHIIAGRSGFDIILCTLDRLLKTNERPIAQQLTRTYYHAIVVFTDPERSAWHFCNLKHIETDPEQQEIARRIRPFRRMVVGETERLRTTSEQLGETAAESGDTALDLHLKMDSAFDVEAVTRRFYKDFVYYYKQFRDRLMEANDLPQSEADVHTQTIFNRLLFLYFVQKRGFLNDNPCYLYDQFRRCPPDVNYYQTYLVPLFRRLSDPDFEAPKLGDIPFLNGGLFEFDPDEGAIRVENDWFEAVYEDLLEHYNFTVREDTEFEQEVAVDPEMLGTVFEQLILGLESKEFEDIPDPRRASGSYYTPKFIVAFMVKESLLGYLQEEVPGLTRSELKRLVYNLEPGHLSGAKLPEIRDKLSDLKAVDPGVGSGAFPVGLLLKMVEIIEAIDEEQEHGSTERPRYRYELKRNLIERCIYGVDIQERAVHLSELRLWLSLLVEVPEPEPLPNLDLHIMTGDSLVSRIGGTIDFNLEKQVALDATGEKHLDRYRQLKTIYETTYDRAKKEIYKERVEEAKRDVIRWFLETRKKTLERRLPQLALMDEAKGKEEEEIRKRRQELKTIERLMERLDELTETFNWGLDFAEIMTLNGGFDVVIGNPPYGVKVPRRVRDEFGLGSRDSYGVFASLGLTILRTHGTLCYIMSDTWQTIGTHKQLRDQLLTETDARYLVSVPNDTFKATVNPGVYLFRKRHPAYRRPGGDSWLLAADFSPLSISDGDVEVAFELLAEVDQATLDESKDGHTLWSDREMAMFAYRQKLIPRFSNHSFFIASPKLFRLMRDVGNDKANPWVQPQQTDFLGGPEQADFFGELTGAPVYSIDFNGRELELVKLGDVADVKYGLRTGDNKRFYFQSPSARGRYRHIDVSKVLKDQELNSLSEDERLYGVDPSKHGGRHIVPLDKGGSAQIESNWLPRYLVPAKYYTDWSREAVEGIRDLRGMRNPDYYFREGIAFSWTGFYSPTFRLSLGSVFDQSASCIFPEVLSTESLLGILNSRLVKCYLKSYVDHTVNTDTSAIKEIRIPRISKREQMQLEDLVSQIIRKQRDEPKYDYMTDEQVEINQLVCKIFNLNEKDVTEVENWFWRRYTKLARAIEGNQSSEARPGRRRDAS